MTKSLTTWIFAMAVFVVISGNKFADVVDFLNGYCLLILAVFGLHTSWPKAKLQSVRSDSGQDLLKVDATR